MSVSLKRPPWSQATADWKQSAASSKPNANPNRSRSRNLSTRMLRITKIQNLQLRVRTMSVRLKSVGPHSQATDWLNLCKWEKEQE